MKLARTTVALTAALALTVSACSSGGEDGETQQELSQAGDYNPQPRDQIADGGSLTTSLSGALYENLNPLHADMNGGVAELARWNTPQLQTMSPEGEIAWNPDYVTDVQQEMVGKNRVVTFTINDRATFNDGTPIDWRAFEARWEVSNGRDKAYAAYSTEGYSEIASVKPGESDKQAVVTYDGALLWWQSQFQTVLHPDVADPETFNAGFVDDLHNEWGAGPYVVEDISPTAVVYERNPQWWGEPGKLDERVFRFMEPTAAINAFRNGEIDAVTATTNENFTQVKGMSDIDVRSATKLEWSMLHINAEAPNLGDDEVRKAIALGFDRAQLQQVQYAGLGLDSSLVGSLTLYPFQDGYRDAYAEAGLSFDPDEAKRLLDAAGWAVGDDGIRERDGERLEALWPVIGDLPTTANVARAAQKMMKDIGVDLVIDNRDASEYVETYTEHNYGIYLAGWGTADPDEGFYYFCSLYCGDTGYLSEEHRDELTPGADQAAGLADREEAVTAFMDLEGEAVERLELIPFWNTPDIWAVKDGLANYGASMFFRARIEDIGWQK